MIYTHMSVCILFWFLPTVCVSDTYVWVSVSVLDGRALSTTSHSYLPHDGDDANDTCLTFMTAFDFHSNPGRKEGLMGWMVTVD